MSCIHEKQWTTKDGRKLHLFEMADEHLKNTKAFLECQLENKEYRVKDHQCPRDILDGPCFDCEAERERQSSWEQWIAAFDLELRRRAADAARRDRAP